MNFTTPVNLHIRCTVKFLFQPLSIGSVYLQFCRYRKVKDGTKVAMRRIGRVDTNDGKKVNRLSPATLDPIVPQMLFSDGVQNAPVESSI